jgi:hypothetical protein
MFRSPTIAILLKWAADNNTSRKWVGTQSLAELELHQWKMLAWTLTCHSSLTQLVQSTQVTRTFVLCGNCFVDYSILQQLIYDYSTTSIRAFFQNVATSNRSNATCFLSKINAIYRLISLPQGNFPSTKLFLHAFSVLHVF